MALTAQPTKDMYLRIDGDIYYVVDRQLKTQGRQGGLIILKMKNLNTGASSTQTIKAGTKVEQIIPETKEVQYLYADETHVFFMDSETFETVSLSLEVVDDYVNFLTEGQRVLIMVYEGEVLSIRRSPKVELKVVESVDAVKGNTANAATKLVTLETGYRVNVPLFVKQGDTIIVNTESGEYSGRAG